jgi:hypothetical protein
LCIMTYLKTSCINTYFFHDGFNHGRLPSPFYLQRQLLASFNNICIFKTTCSHMLLSSPYNYWILPRTNCSRKFQL